MDVKKLKSHFPIFQCEKLTYLDTAATSQRPKEMIGAITDFYTNRNASVHRGVYRLSEWATEQYELARERTAQFINASGPEEIVFTSGTTESINFIADSWAKNNIKEGDEILLTQAEHHANLLPWQRISEKTGAKIKFVELDLESFYFKDPTDLITKNTKLVSLIHVSNVLGNVWRDGLLEKVIARAHEVGAKVLLDVAQSVAHQKIDVQKLAPDFIAFSAHKMCGPTGFGVLYIKKDLHDQIEPYRVGGSMVHDASFLNSTWKSAPQKFEAGTPAIAQAIGFSATIDFFNKNVDFDALHTHESKLCSRLIDGLLSIKKVLILGDQKNLAKSGHLVAFRVGGIHPHDVASMLGDKNICVRAGHHCAQPLAKLLNIESTARASFYMYNDEKDVDRLITGIKEIISEFG